MTDKERIKQLEKQVSILVRSFENKKPLPCWNDTSLYLDKRLSEIFDYSYPWDFGDGRITVWKHNDSRKVKSAITCLVAKCFNKKSISYMSKEEIEQVEPLIDSILSFAEKTRMDYREEGSFNKKAKEE